MIQLGDKSILSAPGAAVSLWLFAHGDDTPETLSAVRAAMLRALQSDSVTPLHHCMVIPRTGERWKLHCRDYFLRKAAMLLPHAYTTPRQIAARMTVVAPPFIAEVAPAWDQLGIPSSARDFDRLLMCAYLTGVPPPKSLRQWQDIVSDICAAI